jgi:hypothetical protein
MKSSMAQPVQLLLFSVRPSSQPILAQAALPFPFSLFLLFFLPGQRSSVAATCYLLPLPFSFIPHHRPSGAFPDQDNHFPHTTTSLYHLSRTFSRRNQFKSTKRLFAWTWHSSSSTTVRPSLHLEPPYFAIKRAPIASLRHIARTTKTTSSPSLRITSFPHSPRTNVVVSISALAPPLSNYSAGEQPGPPLSILV